MNLPMGLLTPSQFRLWSFVALRAQPDLRLRWRRNRAVMFPGFRVKQACNVQEQMESFLKRLKTPVFQPPTLITHGAPAFPILNREQRLSLLLESARNHKLSQAWDEEVEEEPAHIPASSYIEI